jgi:hypothetical protein
MTANPALRVSAAGYRACSTWSAARAYSPFRVLNANGGKNAYKVQAPSAPLWTIRRRRRAALQVSAFFDAL